MSRVSTRPQIAVVGAGLAGLAAAWQARRLGAARVILLERFRIGHDRGSSHGAARITRTTYGEAVYARLMREANAEDWPRLERDSERTLVHRHGGIFFGPPGGIFEPYDRAMGAFPEEVDRLSPAEASRRFPAFRFGGAAAVLHDRTAGVIAARAVLDALLRLCRQAGVDVREQCRVTEIEPRGARLALRTRRGALEADRVIVAAGPWTARLLPGLAHRLSVKRQHVGYYRLPGDPRAMLPERFPVWAYLGRDNDDFYYGLPEFGREGVKAARHAIAGRESDDPDGDRAPSEAALRELDGFAARLFTGPAPERIAAETCLYTNAPAEDFTLDRVPGEPRVVVGAGFSGHGFKFGPLTGRILARLALDGATGIEAFEAERARFAFPAV